MLEEELAEYSCNRGEKREGTFHVCVPDMAWHRACVRDFEREKESGGRASR